ncbi:MAG: hypothetical protein QXF26_02115 [Candidatus Bathyarchaeia archaeon]
MHTSHKREIEEGLATIGRIKVLAELAKKPNESLSKYALMRGTGLKSRDLNANLKHLLNINWVKERRAIHPRYQINLDNSTVRLFYGFLKESGYI